MYRYINWRPISITYVSSTKFCNPPVASSFFNRKMSYTFNLNSLSNRNPLPYHHLLLLFAGQNVTDCILLHHLRVNYN